MAKQDRFLYVDNAYVLSDIHQELRVFFRARQYHNALSAELYSPGDINEQFGGD